MMNRPPRTVLLTGASGFVGEAVLAELLRAGHRVMALCRRPLLHLPAGLAVRHIDLSSPEAAASLAALPPFDVAVHAAGAPKFARREDDAMRRLHVDATVALARECATRGARFIHVSTAYVCPDLDGHLGEGAPGVRCAANGYERTKTDAELRLAELRQPGVDIVRPAIVVPDIDGDIGALRSSPLGAFMAAASRTEGACMLPGEAAAGLAMTRRSDLARAVRAIAEAPAPAGMRWWNLCSEHLCRLGGIADALRSIAPSAQFSFGEMAPRRLEAWKPYLAVGRTWETSSSKAELRALGVRIDPVSEADAARCCMRLLECLPERRCA